MQQTPNIDLDVLDSDVNAADGNIDFRLVIKALMDYRESNMTKIDTVINDIWNMDIDGGNF